MDEFELALVLVRGEARLYLVNPSKVVEILTTTETGSNSELELVDFQELQKGSARESMSELVREYGVVHITSLTREGALSARPRNRSTKLSQRGWHGNLLARSGSGDFMLTTGKMIGENLGRVNESLATLRIRHI